MRKLSVLCSECGHSLEMHPCPHDFPVERPLTIAASFIAAFRTRADTWEREEGSVGAIVAQELRVVIDQFAKLAKVEPDDEPNSASKA